MIGAYYNEHDPKAAAWLRELIKGGHIAPGEVDERDIREVCPDDIDGFRQHHFFAGIGVWSYALRLAGWEDDRAVWTGSCPCQPFSSAGKRKGAADDRHLWPAWEWLIRQHRPDVVFGEQVASKDGIAWLDTVSTDLEGQGYAVAPIVLPACGVGAPHIRQRQWFVADTHGRYASAEREQRGREHGLLAEDGISGDGLGDSRGIGAGRHGGAVSEAQGEACLRSVDHGTISPGPSGSLAIDPRGGCGERRPSMEGRSDRHADGGGDSSGIMAHATSEQCDKGRQRAEGVESGAVVGPPRHGSAAGPADVQGRVRTARARQINGHWAAADWLFCRDGRWRPVEPGSFPLAHGAPARVGRLRGYGNAIVAQVAAEVISAYREVRGG